MRIAYDHQIFGQQENGGISRYFAELLLNLRNYSDVEVSVVAPMHMNRYLLKRGIREHVRGSYFPFRFRGHRRVIGAVNSVALPLYWGGKGVDVVHETLYSNCAAVRGRARVTTIHDMIHELFPDELPASRTVAAEKLAAVRRSDHVICISEATRQDAMQILGLNLEQTSVIYHGCSFHQVAASSEMHAVPRPYILYVGSRGGRYKNFDALLAAFGESSLKGSFDLVAFGGGAFTVSELGKIRKVGISDAIRHVTGDDCLLAGYYRNATAFVYPSRYEGFGFPPLEAMASNCPVICSTAKSVVEIVGEAAAYFDPNDINGLRDSLERVAGDAQFAADLRARGSARVKEYSWQKCAEQTLSVYRQLS